MNGAYKHNKTPNKYHLPGTIKNLLYLSRQNGRESEAGSLVNTTLQ